MHFLSSGRIYLTGSSECLSMVDFPRSSPCFKASLKGSCLGPPLFAIYTRRLFDIVKHHLPQVHCYAHDTQLYVSFSPN